MFDFGFARESHVIKDNEIAGSPRYMAPEMFIGDSLATYQSDAYSYGLVLFEICTLLQPYSTKQKFSFVGRNNYQKEIDDSYGSLKFCWTPPVDTLSSKPLQNVIEECCSFSPEGRPSFDTIVETLESEVKKYTAKKAMGGSSFRGKLGRTPSLKKGLLKVRSKSFNTMRRGRSGSVGAAPAPGAAAAKDNDTIEEKG